MPSQLSSIFGADKSIYGQSCAYISWFLLWTRFITKRFQPTGPLPLPFLRSDMFERGNDLKITADRSNSQENRMAGIVAHDDYAD